MSKELKPCPFCGGTAMFESYLEEATGKVKRYVVCRRCAVHTGYCEEDVVGNIWNTRPAKDALKAEVGRLTHALESIAKNAEFWDDWDDSLAVIYRICRRAFSDNPDTEKGGEDEVR